MLQSAASRLILFDKKRREDVARLQTQVFCCAVLSFPRATANSIRVKK